MTRSILSSLSTKYGGWSTVTALFLLLVLGLGLIVVHYKHTLIEVRQEIVEAPPKEVELETTMPELEDFSYNYAASSTNAFVWAGHAPLEACMALASFKVLAMFEQNNDDNKEKVASTRFVLVTDLSPHKQHSSLFAEWQRRGGRVVQVPPARRDELRRHDQLRATHTWLHSMRLASYFDSIIHLDPLGLPLKSLQHLFTESVSPQAVFVGTKASEKERKKLTIPDQKPVPCFGKYERSKPVSPHVLLSASTMMAWSRLHQHVDPKKRWTIGQMINHEFSCNEELGHFNASVLSVASDGEQSDAWTPHFVYFRHMSNLDDLKRRLGRIIKKAGADYQHVVDLWFNEVVKECRKWL